MVRKSENAELMVGPCGGVGTGTAADYIPERPSLRNMRGSIDACRGCGLWACGRGVFGEGPRSAQVMFVGEQPGDQEEAAGKPFVGPAGKLFDEAIAEAGIERRNVYVTNAVKHFKYERGAKSARRIHKKPTDAEVRACHPWLLQEIRVVKPKMIVVLGATAALSLLGRKFRVTQMRGTPVPSDLAETVIATVHPSSVLRAPSGTRTQARKDFIADLEVVASYLSSTNQEIA